MKPSFHLLTFIILVTSACNGRPNETDQSKAEESAQPGVTDSPGDTGGSIDASDTNSVVVWLGLAARWRKAPGEIFDGFYDSTIQYFKPCGQDQTIAVSRNLIDFEEFPNCDTARGAHISLMMKKKDSLTQSGGGRLVPVDNVIDDKAVIVRDHRVDSVKLPEQEVKRIKEFRRVRAIKNANKNEMERLRAEP